MTNIASDPKFVFEVRGGVLLMFGERTELADGWWFSTNSDNFGPFATDQEALDAAADASDDTAELGFVPSPDPPFPGHRSGRGLPAVAGETEAGKLTTEGRDP